MGLLHGEQSNGAHASRMDKVAQHVGESAAEGKWWMGATRSADSCSMALYDAYREATAV
jgi:hypothetical protein